MSARTGSHRLSSGLYVSGRPEDQLKERQPTMAARAVPYTGGDVKRSGELGRMYGFGISSGDQPGPTKPPSRPGSQHNSGSARSGPKSGSGPMNKKSSSSSFSGPMTPIQPTGLITSGPLSSASSHRRSGRLDASSAHSSFNKALHGSAVTNLGDRVRLGFRVSRAGMWVLVVVMVLDLVAGAFLMTVVKKPVILAVVAAVLVPALVVLIWNYVYKTSGVLGFLRKYPEAELREAIDGQYVKVTGVVTCGSIPLESSFQREPRCVYVSTELYEYRGCGGSSKNVKQHVLSWGCRHSENFVADFYKSDFQSGLRALVKAGYGAKVTPFVNPTTVVDVTKKNKEMSPNFISWVADRGLSSEDCVMRLKEGYIKEGSTVSVMGTVRRHDNLLMIVPPAEPISTGCRWSCCFLPTYIEGLILTCEENQNVDAIPV